MDNFFVFYPERQLPAKPDVNENEKESISTKKFISV